MNIRQAISTLRGHRLPHLRIIAHKKWWFVLSGAFIVLSLVGLVARGLNYSIDFKGGAQLKYPDRTGVTADQWLAGLIPYATTELAKKLKGVDPVGVPADRLTGEPSPGVFSGQSFVEYRLPVDSGSLVLRLVSDRGQWKVDTIDWERTR